MPNWRYFPSRLQQNRATARFWSAYDHPVNVWYDVLVAAHLLGFALVVGGLLTHEDHGAPQITDGVLVGAVVQFGSGALLVAAADPDAAPDHVRSGVTTALCLLLLALAWANRRWDSVPRGLWALMLALALAAAAAGVFWH